MFFDEKYFLKNGNVIEIKTEDPNGSLEKRVNAVNRLIFESNRNFNEVIITSANERSMVVIKREEVAAVEIKIAE